MLTCKEAIELLGEYLERTLGADALQRLEHHLRDCAPCLAYLNTYRRMGELAADALRAELPAEMKARLREFLLSTLAGEGTR